MPYREVYILDGDNTRWETIYEPDPPAAKQADVVNPTTTAAKTTTAPASSFVLGQSNLPGIETRYLDLGESTVPQYFVAGTNIQIDTPTYFEDYFQGPLTESSVPTLVQENTGIYDEEKGGTYTYSPSGEYLGFVEGRRDGSLFGSLKNLLKETAPIWSAALTFGTAGAALGASILPSASAAIQTGIGNAILQGVSSEAQGGDFLKGAALSGANSALGGYVRPELVEATGSNALANALTSGTMAKLSGGEFLQGAIQGGISGATQDAKLALADKYLDAVEPGIGYNPATSPTELDVIQAFPELAPPSDNFSQGVTDILDYAANTPSVQLAAGPTYVGEFEGMPYDPNYTSDAGTGAYRVEVSGQPTQSGWSNFQWENKSPEEYLDSVEPGAGYDDLTSPTEQDVLAAFPELTPNVADAFPELFQNNQDLPIPTQVFIPQQSVQDVVNTISADVSVANPSLTADEVRSIVEGSISNLPPGLSAEDVRTIVTDSLTNLPAAPTQQDIIDIIGGQNFATPDDVRTAISGIQFPAGMTPQDVQSIVSEAFQNNPGINATDVQDIVQGALNNLPPGLSSDDVRNIVTDAVSNIPAAPTEQDIINIIGGQGLATTDDLSNLNQQLTNFDTTNAERYADLIKTVGLVGTGLGALQSTFNLFKDQNTPKQFEIVAPPSDWTSPVYGTPTTTPVPFTPIDFGSPDLLQGTQFARPAAQPFQMPYDLSNMVNTLNFRSVPFVQQPMAQSFTGLANQPTPGLSNIIGNLNGAPVSIADIISNIQGQYGQKAAS